MVASVFLSVAGLIAAILANYNNPVHPGLIDFSDVSQTDSFVVTNLLVDIHMYIDIYIHR